MGFLVDGAAVVDLYRARLAAHRPERHLILLETQGRCQGHRSGAARARINSCRELRRFSPAQELRLQRCGRFHRCGLVRATCNRNGEREHMSERRTNNIIGLQGLGA